MHFSLYCWRALLAAALIGGTPLLLTAEGSQTAPGLTLNEAIARAIVRSPLIDEIRLTPGSAAADLREARGQFSPRTEISVSTSKEVSPSASSLIGSQQTQKNLKGSISLVQPLPGGTSLGVTLQDRKGENDALFTTLDPQWNTALTLSVTQPLLKGAWSGRPGMLVRVRANANEAARLQSQSELANEIQRIVRGYWGQYLSRCTVEVKAKSLRLAEKLKEEADAAVSIGLQPPLSGMQANVQVASREEELIAAQGDLQIAGTQLRRLIGDDTGLLEAAPFELADSPRRQRVPFDAGESVSYAQQHRAELHAQRYLVRAAELNDQMVANGTLPEINFQGGFGVVGLAGTARAADASVAGVPVISGTPPERFLGGHSRAFDELTSGDFYNFSAGFVVRQPLGDEASRSRADRAAIELARARASLRALNQTVVAEVHNALVTLASADQRIAATQAAVKFATDALANGEERFKLGLTTAREVLELQKDLSAAELSHSRALVDHELAITEIFRARGDLLEWSEAAVK